jgi:hypothetical protein
LNAIAPLKKRKADGRMLRGHLEAFYFWVLHQFHCDFSLSLGEYGFSTFPA